MFMKYRYLVYVLALISAFARDMIRDCGAELEDLLQLLLSKKLFFKLAMDFGITKPLGALIKEIEKRNMLSIEIIEKLKLMLHNYNISKHEINIDEERKRTFLPFINVVILWMKNLLLKMG